MWRGLLGKKLGMTQIFTEKGERIGVTVIQAGPCPILQVKGAKAVKKALRPVLNDEGKPVKDENGKVKMADQDVEVNDGYEAYQLGFDEKRVSRSTKAAVGHAKKHAGSAPCKFIREIRLRQARPDLAAGKVMTLADWTDVEEVQVTGTSKGKGFQGVMKRHGFHGLRATHGVKTHHRIPGSSGSLTPARVVKGRKAPGHMGNVRVTTKGLRVAKIMADENLILVEGSIPGANGGYVVIRPAQPYQA